jgi:PAS domain S-box-containing protein
MIDGYNRKILIVDEQPAVLEDFLEILAPVEKKREKDLASMEVDNFQAHETRKPDEEVNYNVVTAKQSQEAISLVKQALKEGEPFAVAFMDIRMPPGSGGMHTAFEIERIDSDIQIVFVTAYPNVPCQEILGNIRVTDRWFYLRKPFDPDEIRQCALTLSEKWNLKKMAEEKNKSLIEAKAELEKRVDERTAELALVNKKLSKEIEKRKQVENALRKSEKKYKTLFRESLEAMCLTQQGKICDVNPAWLRLHGFEDQNDKIGMDIMTIIHPEDRKILSERRKKWPNIKERSFQIRDVRNDGSAVDVEVYSSEISLGGKTTIFSTIRDISNYKQNEKEKRELEEKLLHSEKMEAIGALAGGVAHDLNNILGGLVTLPELILIDLPQDSHLIDSMKTIQKSGQKAAAIVQDLLTLARRGVAVNKVVDLNNIVSEYLLSPEYSKLKEFHSNVETETDLAKGLLPILGSPTHLSKSVMNLVSNAAEAMPSGGAISISTENRYIDRPISGFDGAQEGDYVILRVCDTGVGISAEDIVKIFEPFYTKKVMGRSGTGLGMAVVWGTVKDHKVDVQSTEGKGTMFSLYFPVTRKEVAGDKFVVPIDDYMGKGESILVVDDVEEQREIAYQMLKRLGYCVKSSSSGEEAVAYLKNNSADLLVLDMIMDPGIDGLETYKMIHEFKPNQKAIIVSGFSESGRVKEAQMLCGGAFLKKPYILEKFGIAVRAELDK